MRSRGNTDCFHHMFRRKASERYNFTGPFDFSKKAKALAPNLNHRGPTKTITLSWQVI